MIRMSMHVMHGPSDEKLFTEMLTEMLQVLKE